MEVAFETGRKNEKHGGTILVLDFDSHGHLYTYGGRILLKQLASSGSIPDSASLQHTGTVILLFLANPRKAFNVGNK